MTIDLFYDYINSILNLFFPSVFTPFERLLLLAVYFGVFVFLFRKLKGD